MGQKFLLMIVQPHGSTHGSHTDKYEEMKDSMVVFRQQTASRTSKLEMQVSTSYFILFS